MTFKILKPVEAAAALGVRVNTLDKWRCLNKGPRFVRIGKKRIGYFEADLRSFVADSCKTDIGQGD